MPPHIGGIELVADSLYRAYLAAGFEARWVAAREPGTAAARENGRIRVSCWNGLERKLGVPWPIFGIEGLQELRTLVRWADVLHAHDSLYEASAVAALLARRARKPLILSQHIGFVKYRSKLLNGVEHLANQTLGRAVLCSATRLVFCTTAAKLFAEPFINGEGVKSSFIPNGIDTDRFRPPTSTERESARRTLGVPTAARVALFVGRLVEKKGVDVLAELIERTPSHFFLIVGDGPLRTLIPKEAANLALFPEVAPEQMAKFYQASDVFVLPSHGEGLPLSVQEAMASGLPVIVSRDEAFVEVLDHEGACAATARTSEAFCDSLERLASDQGAYTTLSDRSRELAVRDWSLDVMTERYISLIHELPLKSDEAFV